MKKYILTLAALAFICGTASAQGILGRLGERAKQAVENNVGNKIEKGVNDLLDGKNKDKKDKKSGEDEAAPAVGEESPQAATSTDFKRGEVILFEDDFTDETVGEFPSKWDLLDGGAEVKTLGGIKAVEITNNGVITPLIKEQGAYLPEEFTIEYDFFYWDDKDDVGLNDLKLCLADNTDRSEWSGYYGEGVAFVLVHGVCATGDHHANYNNDSGSKDTREVSFEYKFKQGWHHVALSFNKRALKVYFDGNRVINLPKVKQPTWMSFQVPFDYSNLTFIRNVVIAKGAVELYDRNEQSMTAVEKAIAETGKFVTNNILFETGKATLKPESMEEIKKVADYMKKNPTARFEVQGHTDNQGSDKVNDPLSQQRAEAVVKALEGEGVDPFNLRPVGKGSHDPVADNATEEGRAKNRRVEFIKK
jgi:outer membrane protein OmpA-like peptidoglycan-associated protein